MSGKRGKAIKEFVKIIRKYELTYDNTVSYMREARKICEIDSPKRNSIVPKLPTMEELQKFLAVVEKKSIADKLMMELLLYTGIRSFELCGIELKNIDLIQEKIYIHRKRNLDNYIVIPKIMKDLIRMHIDSSPKRKYLFESAFNRAYTPRAIRYKFTKYREEAGVSDAIHAHNFRHFIITYLASKGWTTQELKKLSGIKNSKNLDIYVNMNPDTIKNQYNLALLDLEKALLEK